MSLYKLKNPQEKEENLIYEIVNYNEVTNRCYIRPVVLHGWGDSLMPQELVSMDELVEVDISFNPINK